METCGACQEKEQYWDDMRVLWEAATSYVRLDNAGRQWVWQLFVDKARERDEDKKKQESDEDLNSHE